MAETCDDCGSHPGCLRRHGANPLPLSGEPGDPDDGGGN